MKKNMAMPLDKKRELPDWMIGAGKRADAADKTKAASKPQPSPVRAKPTPKKGKSWITCRCVIYVTYHNTIKFCPVYVYMNMSFLFSEV